MTMLHNPYTSATPMQRQAASERRQRVERLQTAQTTTVAPEAIHEPLRPIENAEIKAALDFIAAAVPPMGQIETIQRAVAAFYPPTTYNDIKSARRLKEVVMPRQIAMYLAKVLTTRNMHDIGRRFDRDPTTIRHGIEKIERLIKTDEKLAADIEAIKAGLESNS